MKNIITIVLILVLPVAAYLFLSKNNEEIKAAAYDNNLPSLITFTSAMCMDCQKMKGVIKTLEKDYKDKINFISVDALDKNRKVQESIKKYNVVLVPTMVFVDTNGNQINKAEGYIPEEEMVNKIEALINE